MLKANLNNSIILQDYRSLLIRIMFMIIPLLLMSSTITNNPIFPEVFAKKTGHGNDFNVGYADGLADCQSGTSSALFANGNTVTSHSDAYDSGYNSIVTTCNSSQSTPDYNQNSNNVNQRDNSISNSGTQGNSGNIESGTSGSSNSGTSNQVNWEQLCNQYHDILGLKSPCSTYAHGTQLTQTGQTALVCLLGGPIALLLPIDHVTKGIITKVGQGICP